MNAIHFIFMAQGLYYLLTGLWPIFSIGSFQMVTGPKTDLWLVKTVGGLAAASGVTLLVASFGSPGVPIFYLAILNIAVFTTVDIYFFLKKVIGPVYLLDAIFQLLFGFLIIRSLPIE